MKALNIPENKHPRVVVIGGGFAGINLIKNLKGKPFQIVLLDKHNYHTFQPLLYQVATAGLEPDSIAYPLRKIFKDFKHFHFRVATAQSVDLKTKILLTDRGPLDFDHLIIATGSDTNYFGNESVRELSMSMKTVPEALNLRSLMLQNFEEALLTDNYSEREALMNFVIVGAGPTGVELAGALAELKNVVLPKDYPDLDIRQMNIHLVEAAGKVLPPMSDESSARAQRYLEKLGVQVWLDTMVKDYDGKKVLTNKKDLPTRTLIWAAGVTGNTLEGIPSESMEKGRILVDEFNRIKGSESIFAIGDVALMKTEQKPKGDPMVAQTAIQQGETLAKNLLRSSSGKEMKPFQYRDKGSMATVGRNKAVVDIKKFHFGGLFAWFLWMVVHLVALVGFRNRAVALLNWIYNYFSYDKGIRLIIRPWKRKISIQKEETPTV